MSFISKVHSAIELIDTAGFFALVAVSILVGLVYAVLLILLGM